MNDTFQIPTGSMNAIGLLKTIMLTLGESKYVLKMNGYSNAETEAMLQTHMSPKIFKALCTVSCLGQPEEDMRISRCKVVIIDDMKSNYAIYQLVGKG